MRAKLINENLFVPKNKEEIEMAQEAFYKTVGTRFSEINETLERLQKIGIDCKLDSYDINGHSLELITLKVFEIHKNVDRGSLQKIGEVYRQMDGEKIISFLKDNMDLIGTQHDIEYKIIDREYRQPMTNILCLKLLAKLEHES